MSRLKSIKLATGLPEPAPGTKYAGEFMVLVVKNDVQYAPGQYLPKHVVEYLCHHTGWDVTVVPFKEGM